MDTNERRSFVREDVDFKVQYKVMSPEEYEDLKRFDAANFSPFKDVQKIDVANSDISSDSLVNASLINYLVQMDQKLDRILDLISTEKHVATPFCHGIGQNISGCGMQMIIDQPVQAGQIIQLKFLLSKFPFVFMDLFGEIIREKQFNSDGKTLYQVGIKFFALSVNDRDKIVASVFQKQRESIRKRKSAE